MAAAIIMVLATVSCLGIRSGKPVDPEQVAGLHTRAMEKNKQREQADAAMDYYLAKRIGNQSIDLVERLAKARQKSLGSMHGARLTGAGFGGCVVALTEPEVLEEGWKVRASGGARLVAG